MASGNFTHMLTDPKTYELVDVEIYYEVSFEDGEPDILDWEFVDEAWKDYKPSEDEVEEIEREIIEQAEDPGEGEHSSNYGDDY